MLIFKVDLLLYKWFWFCIKMLLVISNKKLSYLFKKYDYRYDLFNKGGCMIVVFKVFCF